MNRTILAVVAIFLFGVVAILSAQSSKPTSPAQKPAASDIPTLSYEKYTLPNGLEVILAED
ncbi:MAG TPA: hypothetical protein VI699_10835, partial [Candidatus Acidoferrales bacterium]|nr:hypothetical protein [Candidatus Acidoferrales bacterium]